MARPRKHVDVMQVLRLRLDGRSLREIASEMRLGRGTVHRYIQSALIALRCPKTPKPASAGAYPSAVGQRGTSIETQDLIAALASRQDDPRARV